MVGVRDRLPVAHRLDLHPGQAASRPVDLALLPSPAGREVQVDDTAQFVGGRLAVRRPRGGLAPPGRSFGAHADAAEADRARRATRSSVVRYEPSVSRRSGPGRRGPGPSGSDGACPRRRRGRRRRAALRTPLSGSSLVGEPEDDAGGEEGDRHRHEEQQLERGGPADLLDEDGEDQAEAGEQGRRDDDPDGACCGRP